MSVLFAADQAHVGRIVDTLVPELIGVYSYETVTRFVTESCTQLARLARVTTFLPVPTERFAKDRLRALAQAKE